MKEKIFIISDVEMGRGDVMDDFSDDEEVVRFIEKIRSENPAAALTLVLNGDIFDFLKMSYKGAYPRHITEEISLWKLEEVFSSHPAVFDALKNFLKSGKDPAGCGRSLHFVIGNHDADLAWPSLQQKIRQKLENTERIFFDFHFKKYDIHAEHGHLLDPFFSMNTKKSIISYKNKKILNTPFGAQICFNYLVDLKKKYPREEQLFPKPLVFRTCAGLKKHKRKIALSIIVKELIWNPLRHMFDPAYRVPYLKLMDHFLHHGTEVLDDEKILPRMIRRLVKRNPDRKVLVLGHAHVLGEHTHKGKTVFVTDTWRNEFDVRHSGAKKKKSYVEISYKGGRLEAAEMKLL